MTRLYICASNSMKRDFKKRPTAKFKALEKLTKGEAREEAQALREGIKYHDYLYYEKNQPKISDAQYDKLFRRLQDLEQKFPEFESDDSPTRRVAGRPVTKAKPVEHAAPMLSLHSAADKEEIARFDQFVKRHADGRAVGYFLEPKFDGVSVELVYEDGQFQRAATRGDGERGDDVSAILKTSKDVPKRLRGTKRVPQLLSVRGEAYLSKRAFQRLNKERLLEGLPPFANPRNAAAGILHRLEPATARWPLELVAYDVLKVQGGELKTQHDAWKQLARWGFKASSPAARARKLDDIAKYHRRLEQRRERLPVEIDGVVIKLDDLSTARDLGTRHRSPRAALAWKFEPREEVTVLEDIVVQVGRTGTLTPVALLAPVDVGGVTVSRATLHNEREVHRKDLRPGDTVRIKRAGDVIPEVVERVKSPRRRGRKFSMPKKCPACGAKVVQEGPNYFCPAGISCPGQLVGSLTHFGSREALDIAGLGEETARQLVERDLVHDVADLYRLTVEDLQSLEGFAEGSARKLRNAIQGAKRPRLDRFLYALAIRRVGERTARTLAREFGSLRRLREAEEDQVGRVVGPVVARSVRKFFDDAAHKRILQRLEKYGVKPQDMPVQKKAQTLKDKTFVFTGTLSESTRNEAKEAVEARGGRIASSVSRNTDYLVVGENPGSKLAEARRNRVRTMDEAGFRKVLGR